MEFASIIPNFFNILSGVWMNILYTITLFFDGIVFSLVSIAFDVFIMTCQLNFDALYAVIAPLLDRLEAVIMVLVVFKLGISFIGYMIEPEKAPAEGKKLIINIFITAALLLSYNFIFSVFNDISMLLLGAPENYPYTTLSSIADIQPGEKDEGLIMRFIFGKNDAIKNSNIGDFMAYQTLSMFLSNTTGQDVLASILDPDGDGNYEFTRLAGNAPKEIDKTLSYMPIVSMVVGLYLVYSIVKVSIEIGIRMFKMLILQILAPIAIITCIDGGFKSKTFSTYYKTFLGVFVQVFIRVFVMYIITVFVCKFFIALPDFFHELPSGTGFKKLMVAVIVIVAGFKMVNDIPKFIDEALGTKIAGADGSKGGFGKFVGGLIGGGIGLATGLGAGMAAGSGLFGSLGNALAGGVTGFTNGSKGAKASEMIKNIGESNKANRERATKIARQGGGLRYAGAGIENFLGVPQRQALQSQRVADDNKAIQAVLDAEAAEIAERTDSNGIKYGSSADSYASAYADHMLKGNADYEQAKRIVDSANQAGETARKAWLDANPNDQSGAQKAAEKAIETASKSQTVIDARNRMESLSKTYKETAKQEWERTASSANGDAVIAARKELDARRSDEFNGNTSRSELASQKKVNNNRMERLNSRAATRRANRQGGFGGN